jgi:hypothetical protein
MASAFGAQMKQPRLGLRHHYLRSELRDHERVKQPPQEVTVGDRCLRTETQRRRDERRVDDVALRGVHETLEPIRRPRRHLIDHQ